MTAERHPDRDTLTSLCAAMDWQPIGLLEHVMGCPECRSDLERLAGLRTALSESVVPDPGFTSRVVAAARAETERAARGDRGAPARAARRSWRLLNPALATVTTFTALVMASGGAAVRPGVAPLLSLAAGMAVLAWEGRRPEPGVARAA